MTTPEPADLSQAHAEITRLRAENEKLRAELTQRQALPRTRSIEALKFGGSFLLPMLDRQKVFRTFIAFFNEASYYSLPQEHWPPRERVLERARDFGLAVLRFFVKRRLVVFMFSLLAFLVPLVQVWLVFQQNAIIENQNKYFNIQVYDIVAQSLTGDDPTAKQITSALLAREDFELINGIIKAVFEDELTGISFTEQDTKGTRPALLKATGARGHLVSALGQALDQQVSKNSPSSVWNNIEKTYRLVINDAANRLPNLLRTPQFALAADPIVEEECFRYMFSLSSLMRRTYALSTMVGKEDEYFSALAPMVGRVSQVRTSSDAPLLSIFAPAFGELLVEIPQKPKLGQKPPELDAQTVERYVKEGFRTLVDRTKAAGANVNEGRLKQLLEVQ